MCMHMCAVPMEARRGHPQAECEFLSTDARTAVCPVQEQQAFSSAETPLHLEEDP